MEPLHPRPRFPERRRRPEPVGAPRRFGVGTLLVIATMYALLFSLLKVLNTPPAEVLIVVGFCTLVGFAQAALFRGKKPRLASFLVGGVVCTLPRLPYVWQRLDSVMLTIVFPFLFGGVFGYVVGCLIGGAFLVLKWFVKEPSERQTPDAANRAGEGDTEDDSN